MSTRSSAPTDKLWAALTTVTDYPQWTKSITAVTPLDDVSLTPGHRFRVQQPGMPPLVWTVTDVEPGRSYAWESSTMGVRTVGRHWLTQQPDGSTQINLEIEQTGLLAKLVWALTGARTRRYMGLEANGIKTAAEARSGEGRATSTGGAQGDSAAESG